MMASDVDIGKMKHLADHLTRTCFSTNIEDRMAHYGTRLASFKDWNSQTSLSCLKLADAGFYYTGEDDEVACSSCRVLLGNWHQRSQPPLEEHRRASPRCPFISNNEESDLPSRESSGVVPAT
eukprot:GHVT01021242.1.p1 GENE.GHVT01021242.1~~GHVT01021242.1.p1  ORF type:complete len:123 (+),score=3.39 GHVT01021242.1:29-397(+)